jgi:nicotinate-nucleotide adenylyltransferase
LRINQEQCYYFGTFNPIHSGHVALAKRVQQQFGFKKVVFVPANVSPLKQQAKDMASFSQRARMIELACGKDPTLGVSRVEATLPAPSYTVQTLRTLFPHFDKWWTRLPFIQNRIRIPFIIGTDALQDLPKWNKAQTLARNLRFIVGLRDTAPLVKHVTINGKKAPLTVQPVQGEIPPVSSTQVRNRARQGLPMNDLVPPAVADYIRTNRLYRFQGYPKSA